MGFNSDNSLRLIFDVETCPLPDAAEFIEQATAPSNYKDPAKIAAYINEANAENVARAGLDVDLCQVVALGFCQEGMEPIVLTLQDCDEDGLISRFWSLADQRHLVGYNCLAFDLPVLFRRSQYLGIPAPSIQIDKYKHPAVTDLQMVLSFNGAIKYRGLSFYAKRFGIPSEDKMTGADIAQAVIEGRWNDIRNRCESDVRKTAAIAEKLGLFRTAGVAV